MKKVLIFLFCLCNVFFAIAQKDKAATKPLPKSVLKNAADSFSYAVGVSIASSMKQQGLGPVNFSSMQKGMDAVFNSQKKIMDENLCNLTIQQKMQENMSKKMAAEKAKGRAFLEANGKRKEVITLPGGMQYEIIKSAPDSNQVKPTTEDFVRVNYTGTLIEGREFDRGQGTEFRLTGVITGWTQILQLMRVGDHWKVYIPSELAYGDTGNGPDILPGATLIFDMTLVEIRK